MKKALSICFSVIGLSKTIADGLHNYFSRFRILAAVLPMFLISVFSSAQTLKLEQGQNGGVDKIEITNSDKFWSASKYLVIVVE